MLYEQSSIGTHSILSAPKGLSNGFIPSSESQDTILPVDPMPHSEPFLTQLYDHSPTIKSSLTCKPTTVQENSEIQNNIEQAHLSLNTESINPLPITNSATLVNDPNTMNASNTQHVENTSVSGSNCCVSQDRGRSRNMRAMSRSERRLHSASPYRKKASKKQGTTTGFPPWL